MKDVPVPAESSARTVRASHPIPKQRLMKTTRLRNFKSFYSVSLAGNGQYLADLFANCRSGIANRPGERVSPLGAPSGDDLGSDGVQRLVTDSGGVVALEYLAGLS